MNMGKNHMPSLITDEIIDNVNNVLCEEQK